MYLHSLQYHTNLHEFHTNMSPFTTSRGNPGLPSCIILRTPAISAGLRSALNRAMIDKKDCSIPHIQNTLNEPDSSSQEVIYYPWLQVADLLTKWNQWFRLVVSARYMLSQLEVRTRSHSHESQIWSKNQRMRLIFYSEFCTVYTACCVDQVRKHPVAHRRS